jgi:hypothetical protein
MQKQREDEMSKQTAQRHHEAAKELELAAHHLREAAVHYEVGEDETAAQHSRRAAEHMSKADERVAAFFSVT